jgi:hypothetical protein
LLRVLDNLVAHNVVLEFTIYSLSPSDVADDEREDPGFHIGRGNAESLRDRARLTSPAVAAIRGFLSFVAAHAADAESLGPFVNAALEGVW